MADLPRFFLSLELDRSLKESLGDYALNLAPRFAGSRPAWVKPGLYHLTLHFFGPADGDFPRMLGEAMRPAAAATPRPFLRSAGLTFLPGRGEPRVLCMRFVLEPEDCLHSILAEARRVASMTRTRNEDRPWLPHLSLARFRARGGAWGVPALSTLPDPPVLGFSPDACSLFASTLLPAGPRHERLDDYSFAH